MSKEDYSDFCKNNTKLDIAYIPLVLSKSDKQTLFKSRACKSSSLCLVKGEDNLFHYKQTLSKIKEMIKYIPLEFKIDYQIEDPNLVSQTYKSSMYKINDYVILTCTYSYSNSPHKLDSTIKTKEPTEKIFRFFVCKKEDDLLSLYRDLFHYYPHKLPIGKEIAILSCSSKIKLYKIQNNDMFFIHKSKYISDDKNKYSIIAIKIK